MPSNRGSFLAASGAVLATLSGCVTFDPPATTGTWSRHAIDNAHTGHSETDGPRNSLHEVWHRDRPYGGSLDASPVVGDGRVYLVYAKTGEKRGQFELGRNQDPQNVPAVADELVFVNTNRGRLFAIGECGTELAGHCLVG